MDGTLAGAIHVNSASPSSPVMSLVDDEKAPEVPDTVTATFSSTHPCASAALTVSVAGLPGATPPGVA